MAPHIVIRLVNFNLHTHSDFTKVFFFFFFLFHSGAALLRGQDLLGRKKE